MNHVKSGALIKTVRKRNNLTQKELAQKLEISDKAVSKWEVGKGFPDVNLLVPLCAVLNITVDELLRGELKCK